MRGTRTRDARFLSERERWHDSSSDETPPMRIDKWLWAARFFKSRALAARACELGRIDSNGQPVKPARELRVGDLLRVKNDSGDFQVEVMLLSETRGPATVAQTLY